MFRVMCPGLRGLVDISIGFILGPAPPNRSTLITLVHHKTQLVLYDQLGKCGALALCGQDD